MPHLAGRALLLGLVACVFARTLSQSESAANGRATRSLSAPARNCPLHKRAVQARELTFLWNHVFLLCPRLARVCECLIGQGLVFGMLSFLSLLLSRTCVSLPHALRLCFGIFGSLTGSSARAQWTHGAWAQRSSRC